VGGAEMLPCGRGAVESAWNMGLAPVSRSGSCARAGCGVRLQWWSCRHGSETIAIIMGWRYRRSPDLRGWPTPLSRPRHWTTKRHSPAMEIWQAMRRLDGAIAL